MFVYIIKVSGLSLFKVGYTNDVARRQSELQTGNPFSIEPYAILGCESVEQAREVESHLQQAMGGKTRAGGKEWHMVEPNHIRVILFEAMTKHNENMNWKLKWVLQPNLDPIESNMI